MRSELPLHVLGFADRTAGVFQLYKRGPLDAVSLLETHYSGRDERDAA